MKPLNWVRLIGEWNKKMTLGRLSIIAVSAIAITACSGSKTDSGNQDSANLPKAVEQSQQPSKVAPEPETYSVNGKEVKVNKGITTKEEVLNVLGEPTVETNEALNYQWRADGKLYQYVFFFMEADGTFSNVQTTSVKI